MQFLKSTLMTGLYVLLPLLLLWLGLREIGGLLAAMAEPIADMFPSRYFDDLRWPGIVAAILIASFSIVIGTLARLSFVADLAHRFETTVLYRVPMYRMLKIISSSLVKPERSEVRPAIVRDEAATTAAWRRCCCPGRPRHSREASRSCPSPGSSTWVVPLTNTLARSVSWVSGSKNAFPGP